MSVDALRLRPITVEIEELHLKGFQRPITRKSTLLDTIHTLAGHNISFVRYGESVLSTVQLIAPSSSDPDTRLVFDWFCKYFHESQEPRVYMAGEAEKNEIRIKAENACMSRLGFSYKEIKSEFDEDDLATLGIRQEELSLYRRIYPTLYPQKVSCFIYALLKAKEIGVREFIFLPRDEEADDSLQIIQMFHRWGYQEVETPQAGDFVLYVNDGELTHLARLLENGVVESKTGSVRYCYRHPLNLYYPSEGMEVIFLRKTAPGNYTNKIL